MLVPCVELHFFHSNKTISIDVFQVILLIVLAGKILNLFFVKIIDSWAWNICTGAFEKQTDENQTLTEKIRVNKMGVKK